MKTPRPAKKKEQGLSVLSRTKNETSSSWKGEWKKNSIHWENKRENFQKMNMEAPNTWIDRKKEHPALERMKSKLSLGRMSSGKPSPWEDQGRNLQLSKEKWGTLAHWKVEKNYNIEWTQRRDTQHLKGKGESTALGKKKGGILIPQEDKVGDPSLWMNGNEVPNP